MSTCILQRVTLQFISGLTAQDMGFSCPLADLLKVGAQLPTGNLYHFHRNRYDDQKDVPRAGLHRTGHRIHLCAHTEVSERGTHHIHPTPGGAASAH